MSERTQIFQIVGWDGGLDVSRDPSLIDPNDLVQADNSIITQAKSRRKRGGLQYWDAIRFTTARASTTAGTSNRTLTIGSGHGISSNDIVTAIKTDVFDSLFDGTIKVVSTTATSITYTHPTGVTSSDADTNTKVGLNSSDKVIAGMDFWLNDGTQRHFAVHATLGAPYVKFYSYTAGSGGGIRTAIPFDASATALVTTPERCNLHAFNNKLIISFDGTGNLPKTWDGNLAHGVFDLAQQVETITFSAVPNAGSFKLQYNGVKTVALDKTLTPATLQAALRNVSGLESIEVEPSGSFLTNFKVAMRGLGAAGLLLVVTDNTLVDAGAVAITTTVTSALVTANYVPDFEWCFEHEGSLFANDKSAPHRLNFCEPFDQTVWLGHGNSGALNIRPGDGDPYGLTGGISHKGIAFVWKRNKSYRVNGSSPIDYSIQLVSDGIGCISHQSIVSIDQDQVIYASDRGFHYLSATQAYGDFQSTFASLPIQGAFLKFESTRKRNIQGIYFPDINSVLFCVSEDGSTTNNAIYAYNVETRRWTRFYSGTCSSIYVGLEAQKRNLYVGTNNGRILRYDEQKYFDFGRLGASLDAQLSVSDRYRSTKDGIPFTIKSGYISPAGNLRGLVAFKRLTLYFRYSVSFNFNAYVKIDNYPSQSLVFQTGGSADLLNVNFTLGTSALAGQAPTLPYSLPIEGLGHAAQISITNSAPDQSIELVGFALEFEPAGIQQETFDTQGSS